MSYAAERWARAQTAGNSRAKSVLIEIAHCLNGQTGKCTPSVSYLATVTEMRPHTVCSATTHLVNIGLITKTTIKTPTGKACSYALVGFNPSEWEHDKVLSKPTTPRIAENSNTHIVGNSNTSNDDVVENDNTRIAETDKTGIAETDNRTGNKNREEEQEIHPTENSDPKKSLISEEELFSELPPPSDEDIRATVTVTESSPKKRNTTSQEVVEKPEGVDDDLWKEWNQFRKKKRAPVTPRVLSNLARQTSNAGISISEGMVIQMEQGWTGFQASWIKPDMRHTANNAPQVDEWTQKNLGKKINGQTVLLRQEQRVYGNKLFQQYKKEAA